MEYYTYIPVVIDFISHNYIRTNDKKERTNRKDIYNTFVDKYGSMCSPVVFYHIVRTNLEKIEEFRTTGGWHYKLKKL